MSDTIQLQTARTAEEVERFRSLWEEWQTHPDNDIDNFLARLRSRRDVLRPHVILISKGDSPLAIVVGCLLSGRASVHAGYKTIPGPRIRILSIPYQGILGQIESGVVQATLEALTAEMKQERIDKLEFNWLPEGSLFLDALSQIPGAGSRTFSGAWAPHWRASLPDTVEAFWAKLSSRHRMFLRRVAKALDKEFPDGVRYAQFSKPSEIDLMCAQLEEIAKKTYLRGMGRGFQLDAERQERLRNAAQHGRLRTYILSVGGKPVSYAVGSVYRGSYALAYTAYDPEFKHFDVGQLVLVHMIESLCREGVRQVDFGFGTALYKERFGDTRSQERTVALYAPTLRAVTIAAVLRASNSLLLSARKCLDRLGVVATLKRRWRDRLSGTKPDSATTNAANAGTAPAKPTPTPEASND